MSPLLIKISKDFATLWTTIDRLHPAAKNARRVGGHVADKPLRRDIGHLHGHIAASGEDRLAVSGEHRAADPVAVGGHVNDLLQRICIERP